MDEEAILLEEMVALQMDVPTATTDVHAAAPAASATADVEMTAMAEGPKPGTALASGEAGGSASAPGTAAETVTVPLAWLRQLVAAAKSAGDGPPKVAPAAGREPEGRAPVTKKRAREAPPPPRPQQHTCCCCPCRRAASPAPGPSGAQRRRAESPRDEKSRVPKSRRNRREGRVSRREAVREKRPPKKTASEDARKCWRCGLLGHPYSQCPLPPAEEDRFCYRCGKQGVTVADCPRRHKGAGAGRSRPEKPQ